MAIEGANGDRLAAADVSRMIRATGTATIVACCVLTAACATAPAPVVVTGSTVTFVGVNVVPMTADTVLANQTVVVRDGSIAAIGDATRVRVPPGAVTIDGRGRFLLPGLVDSHVHLEYFDDPAILRLFLDHGITTVRNMDGRPYLLAWRERVRAGELAGPNIITAGPILDGDPPARDDNTAVPDSAAAAAHVAAQRALGYDFIKVYTNLGAEAHAAVVGAARTHGMFVTGHVPRSVPYDSALARGQRGFEHLGDFARVIEADDSPLRGRFHWSKLHLGMPVDASRLAALAQRLAAAGAWLVPTVVQADRVVPTSDSLARWAADPLLAHVPGARDVWLPGTRATLARMDADDWELVRQGRANRLAALRALRRAGVLLTAGTDTPNPWVIPGASLHLELRNFAAAGYSNYEALDAATRRVATALGELANWGTVEQGKRADLLLISANPLGDLGALERPVGVMVRGRWYTCSYAEPHTGSRCD